MNAAESARMARFFHWLCEKRAMNSWDAGNECDLLDQIVTVTGTKIVYLAGAPGYSRRCAAKLVDQNVFDLFPSEYAAICQVLDDFVAFVESEAKVGTSTYWSVQEYLYTKESASGSKKNDSNRLKLDCFERETRVACRVLDELGVSLSDAGQTQTEVEKTFYRIRKKLEIQMASNKEESVSLSSSREAHLPLEMEKRYRKLKQKILQAFDGANDVPKIHYIGEVPIDDKEYALLLEFTRYQLQNHSANALGMVDSPLVATALVQMGIRTYNGSYWPHVAQELNMEKISQPSQRFLNETFQNTARKHGLVVLTDSQVDSRTIQSILFHGVVSNHYATGLFDLLFRFYDRDLGRNLAQNTPERIRLLLDTIRQSEKSEAEIVVSRQRTAGNASKAYMLRRHTIAALTAFPEINGPRLQRYIEMIDSAFWYQQLPEKSSDRLVECFRKWAENSPDLKEQYRIRAGEAGMVRRKRYFQTPYLHADLRNGTFELCLPEQILRQTPEGARVSWRVQSEARWETVDCEIFEAVCGLKTDESRISIEPMEVLSEIMCNLCVGETVLNRFKIAKTCARFFDEEGDQENTLSSGVCIGFTSATECLQSAALLGDEIIGTLHRWEFHFEKGDVVLFPDATGCCIGENYTEGLLRRGLVPSVQCENLSATPLPVYNLAPEILLLVEEEKMEGISLFVNGKRYRLTDCDYKKARESNQRGKQWVLLSTATFIEIQNNAVNSVAVELPGANFARKPFVFALCSGLHLEFEDAPYVFEERGTIRFSTELKVERVPGMHYDKSPDGNSFNFELAQPDGKLHFVLSDAKLPIAVDIPAFSWSANQVSWQLGSLGDVWAKDFPYDISLRGPFQEIGFDFGIAPSAMRGDSAVMLTFSKSAQTGIFHCDLTRARSWITRDKACYPVKLLLDGKPVPFGRIFAKSILLADKIELIADFEDRKLTLICDVIGRSKNYYVDIQHKNSGKLFASKVPFDGKRLELHCEIPNGEYEVTVFETDDDDFFDDTYYVLGVHSCTLLDRNNLSGKQILLKYISRKLNGSFRYMLKENLRVCNLQRDEPRVYRAELIDGEENAKVFYRVQLTLPDTEELSSFFLKYWDEKYEEYYEFDYDRMTKLLLTENEEEKSLPYSLRYRRYTTLFEDQDKFVGIFEDACSPAQK